jgi:hypothetical protein
VLEVLNYLQDPTAASFNSYNMGIYAEGGFRLSKVFAVKLGYFWPWAVTTSSAAAPSLPDRFVASFEMEKGAIALANLWASISYERTNLFFGSSVPANLNDVFFSAYADFKAQISYALSPSVDISLLYTITPVFNADGTLQYSGNDIIPDMATSASIVTSIQL